MHFPTTTLMTAVYERLTGEDGAGLGLTLDGAPVDVYVRGAVPTDAQPPCVVIEPPRLDGEETLDGHASSTNRLRLRVHDRYPAGRANAFRALLIADRLHQSLEGAPLTLEGFRTPYVPEPSVRPIPPYEAEGQEARDLLVIYDLRI